MPSPARAIMGEKFRVWNSTGSWKSNHRKIIEPSEDIVWGLETELPQSRFECGNWQIKRNNDRLELPLRRACWTNWLYVDESLWFDDLMIDAAHVSDGRDQSLESDLKTWEADATGSKWDGVGPVTSRDLRAVAGSGGREGRDCVLPSPSPSHFTWTDLGRELAHGRFKIGLLLYNGDWYLDDLWSIIQNRCSNSGLKSIPLHQLISE